MLSRRLSSLRTMTIPKHSLSDLPLPPPATWLTRNLTPDPSTPSVAEFRNKVLTNTPSLQRRARLLSAESHFSYVTPMPMPFPYDIDPPSPSDEVQNKGEYIEKWLAQREAIHNEKLSQTSPLRKYFPRNRDQARELIGLSETGLRDCLPHLDVGDAFSLIGAPTLANSFSEEGDGAPSDSEGEVAARRDLVDVLSGYAVLMNNESESTSFAPWSLRYSGHQFGSWAGQLGDGRAISVLVTPHPSNPDLTYELQLKGAGRTPFSRSADGLAVLRSSIREYLCSEAMQALGIPTTRSLSLISLPALQVQREKAETACIFTRVAPSFLRIGCFEAFNGPTEMFFFGGGQQKPNWDGLRVLGEYVSKHVLKLNLGEGEAWGTKLVLEVSRRNAKMVAGWQAYGFMHGVINTDNVSLLGLTIDYGPYAFMDVFDSFHICNHTDEGGRYAYKYQPNMIIYALRALLNALAPLIGAEHEFGDRAVPAGWANDISKEKIDEWRRKGLELRPELERVAQQETADEYGRLLRKRLALRRVEPTDETRLFKPLLDIMETHKLDFHGTFRTLSTFKPSLLEHQGQPNGKAATKGVPPDLESFITTLLAFTPQKQTMQYDQATTEWLQWLDKYAERIESEKDLWGTDRDAERTAAAKSANPRFVLRQWLLEEVIHKVERDADSGKRVLAKVMHMACNPFEPWGAEGDAREESDFTPEEKEERRYCGMGDTKMLGFQCSCSS
ncbi:UPF0061-domain-containing protein [Pluteus cervinus]|uniref:UPF0061-domain-containing protein n=1 Tax=Pluteus cervinus TaxID=181527 RepID=A0ACD3B554_9AGAR|nr:UPF0061-domain-containing protein [Pluteus cervinus]